MKGVREFEISATIYGFNWVEDPKCPSEWKGSGCYDLRVHDTGKVIMHVWADSEERAAELANEHEFEFTGDWFFESVEEVRIDRVKEIPGTEGMSDDEEGVENVEYL